MDPAHKPRVCISLCEPTLAALRNKANQASSLSGLVELRVDCLEPSELRAEAVSKLVAETNCQTIVTLRPVEQGGNSTADVEFRESFWRSADFGSDCLFDLELDLVERFVERGVEFDWSRTICSYHDFSGQLDNLESVYDRLAATPARILKLAIKVDDATDCRRFFKLLESAKNNSRELIPIAIGTAGVVTRILGPSRGAFLTYSALSEEDSVAPGQLSFHQLRDLYRIYEITDESEIFGVVGAPISHSLSPIIHNAAFAAAGRNAVYIPFEVQNIERFLEKMVHPRSRELDWSLRGLSVTAPHKTAVMAGLDCVDPIATKTTAVNTVIVVGNELHGYNTDANAFLNPLVEKLGDLRGVRCAVIGSGGMAQTAVWTLSKVGALPAVFARNATKAKDIAEEFGGDHQAFHATTNLSGFDVVINTTPLGTFGTFREETPVTTAQLRGARLAYDLVYNPTETRFLHEARAAGCATLGGLPMFIAQAEAQFEMFMGERAPADVMHKAAEEFLKQ